MAGTLVHCHSKKDANLFLVNPTLISLNSATYTITSIGIHNSFNHSIKIPGNVLSENHEK